MRFLPSRRDQDLDEEIQSHLAMAARDRIERGEAPAAAVRAARREFGNPTLIQEVMREVWGWASLERLVQDVQYALRGMRRSPGFTAVAVLSLALGIGANTAIFSLIDTLMLRLLPVQHPEQLVELMQKYPGEPRGNGFWSWQSYEHYRAHNHVFSSLIGASPPSLFNVRGDGLDAETVNGEYVTSDFFPGLGVKPAIGRLIGPEDDRSGVAVVSWAYWKSRFNLDPAILGKRIVVENSPATIIGVAPPEFFGLQVGFSTDVWLPRPMSEGPRLLLLGRLEPGVSIEQARAEMAVLYLFTIDERTRTSKDPLLRQLKIEVEPAGAGLSFLRDRFAKPLLLLMTVVGLLLFITCTNVASMLLARGAARRREMALRVALGAGRFRLVRQMLTESLLLSGIGGVLGVFVAYFGADALVRMLTSGRQIVGLPAHLEIPIRPDARVLLFTVCIALLTTLLFGLAPASNAFSSGRILETRFRRLFGKSLVVTQVALSVVLLSAAGFFIRHLQNLRNIDLGFRRDHVLLMTLDPSRSGYKPEQFSGRYQELLARLESIPGVSSATIGGATPISGVGASRFITADGFQERPEDRRYVAVNWVAPKYFETLGTPFLAGRDFTFEDRGRVTIINQSTARYYFADSNPVGRHLTLDGDDQPYEIVGVVGDARYYEIREAPLRGVYFSAFQEDRPGSRFVIRTNIDPAVVAPEMRRAVRDLLKNVPVTRVTTMADQVDASIVPERMIAALSGWFGALGSLLAAIGLYGLLAYTVARRVNEIGIRMALGATRSHVTRMVLGEALSMVCAGLAAGVPIAFWGRTYAASLIQDLPMEIAPIALGAAAMIAVALMAASVPARRAARVEPMEALRHE